MSKYTFIGLVVQLALAGMLLAKESHAQKSIEEIYLRVAAKTYTLGQMFDDLEQKTSFRFVYQSNGLDENQTLTIEASKASLADILRDISMQTGLQFRRVNQTIHVSAAPAVVGSEPAVTEVMPEQVRVSGTVTSADDNAPLPGVSIVLKGTTTGTTTDFNGNYSLSAPADGVLLFSYIGYVAQEVAIGSQTTINVVMQSDLEQLKEVVVIGYGQRERKDLTGAISQISSKEITKQVTMSPEFAMQGRMPGVFVSNPGSGPTARPNIRIRGVGTLGFNDPLYVVDGVPLYEGGAANADARAQDQRGPINVFALINPNDIESISVLKDASATAIYGVRAANGVVLITTKRGQEGKMRVDITANYGIQNINKVYDVVSVQEYVDITREAWANRPGFVAGAPDVFLFDPNNPNYLGNSPSYSQDWMDNARVRNAAVQDYNISISGGNKMSNYSVGVGFSNQEDAYYFDRFKRYSVSINSDHKLTKWMTAGQTFRGIYGRNNSANGRPTAFGAFTAPWQPLLDPNDPLGFARPGRLVNNTFRGNGYGTGSATNFLAIDALNENQRDLYRNIASAYLEIKPIKGLRVRGTYSVDYMSNVRELYDDQRQPLYNHTQGVINPNAGNIYGRRINENVNLVGEFLIGYNETFGKHNVDVVLNAMDQRVYWNNSQLAMNQRSPIPSWEQRRIEEGWNPADKGLLYERTQAGLQGYMARASYNFDRRYYLDVTVRRDGSSKFGPGYKWGTFPSVAGAWRISSESFMSGISFISDLKIRAGWGRIGNQEVRDFAYLSLINVNPKVGFGTNPTEAPGNGVIQDAAALLNIPTDDLTWETVTTSNVGFDAELFDGKFRFTAEYYSRLTDDILQTYPVPGLMGFINNPVVNLAQVSNRGFEFEGTFNQNFGEFNLNVGFNLTTTRNRVERLFNDVPVGSGSGRIQVGHSINSIFGYRTAGIFQSQQEVTDYLATTGDPGFVVFKGPGDVRYVDFAGAPAAGSAPGEFQSIGADGVVNAFDQTVIGKTIPGYFYGLNLGGNYKNFDMSIFFRGVGDVQQSSTLGLLTLVGTGGNFVTDYRNRWTENNPSNTIPRAIQGDPSGNNRFSDRFVHNAGFFRLQNMQVGYTVPNTVLSKVGVSTLRVSVTAMNLFVLAPSFPDLDPENITTPTTFTFGLNLGF